MKYLIIGGSGLIGAKFVKYFIKKEFDFAYTYFQNTRTVDNAFLLDIREKEHVEEIICNFKPDIVIHTSALTNIDLCETDKKMAFDINVTGIENVLNACKKINAKIVYISTSHVFSKNKDEFFEIDETSPMNYYGTTKDTAEKMIINSNTSYLILRTDQPYCWIESGQKTNSVLRVISSIRALKEFSEINDWQNCPTYVPNFISVCMSLIEKNKTGIFHVAGKDFINRYEWGLKICEIFNLDSKYLKSISSNKLNLPAIRPNVKLNSDKASKTTGISLMGINEGMLKMRNENEHL